MQSDSSSLDTLKNSLLSAVDAEHNVTNPESVLDIISQLEKIEISRDQLQTTRLGREINTIRQKIDARKKSAKSTDDCPPSLLEIAQRAKKLLRSWQGLLNTSQTDSNNISTTSSSSIPQPPPPPAPSVNGETHESTSPLPRLILKVKINPSKPSNSNNDNNNNSSTTTTTTKTKRKHDSEPNGLSTKRRKAHIETPITPPPPISPAPLIEPSTSLPRLKTTQQLLLEMQLNQPDVLSTQTPTVNAILQHQIIDASLNDTGKVDYSALHHGRDTIPANVNKISSSTLSNRISPPNATLSTGSSTKRPGLVRPTSSTLLASNTNWENGYSAGGSPVSPSSSSSSSIGSTTSWPISTNIPEPPSSIPVIPKKKRRRKHSQDQDQEQQQQQQPPSQKVESYNIEQSTPLSPDLATICSSYSTVAELVEAHRRRILAEHDTRELEARPDLLLVPIDQLVFVYERERTNETNLISESKQSSLTTVDTLDQPNGLIALPFIDCPLEFDLVLDELVVQQPTMDM